MPGGENRSGRALSEEDVEITLGVLTAVQNNRAFTQRSVAQELGIALGLANTYVRRCIKKGYIKLRQAPANRYVYYLTRQGFAEKSRLTAKYLSQSLILFRVARKQIAALLDRCAENDWERVALCGIGDLCEIAHLSARSRGINLVGIVDRRCPDSVYDGLPVVRSVSQLGFVDAVILTDMSDPLGAYDEVRASFTQNRILILPLLNLGPGAAADPDADGAQP